MTELVIADFDKVIYHLSNPDISDAEPGKKDRTKLLLSIRLNFYKELQEHGADELLQNIYGQYIQNPSEYDYNVSLLFDLNSLPDNWKDVAYNASLLKRNCFASVFEKFVLFLFFFFAVVFQNIQFVCLFVFF
jgi:actin related protein 2/3 complex, subunit 2